MKYQHALWTTEEASQEREQLKCATVGGVGKKKKQHKLWNLTDLSLGSGYTIYHLCDLFRSIYSHAYLELQRVGHD